MIQQPPPYQMAFDLAEFCRIAELEPEAVALLRDEMSPREFVDGLAANECYADAVRFLAHLLPTREAIFWAWSSARRVLDGEPAPPVAAALEATGRWIAQPSEENRWPMLEVAEAAPLGTPAGSAALAVFLSGGSIAPPDVHPVEPPPYAAAKAITGSIVLAAVSNEPEKAPEKFQGFIAQGVDIGKRIGLWPPDPPAA
jgi:hypothetical protein